MINSPFFLQLTRSLKKLPFFRKIRQEVFENFKNLEENSFDFFEKFIHLVLKKFDIYPKALIPFFIDKKVYLVYTNL